MDRDAIERRDFPTVRRGYDPAAVDAHLRQVADEIERGRPSPATAPGLAAGASEQVRAILEAAETSAAQLRAEAGAEARGHLERVQGAASELSARLDDLAIEFDRVLDGLRAGAGRLNAGLLDLRARVAEFGPVDDAAPAPPRDERAVGAEGPVAPAGEFAPGRGPVAPAGESAPGGGPLAPAGEFAPGRGPLAPAGEPGALAGRAPSLDGPTAAPARSTDEEGARLAALELALSGRSREEAERYLGEHFDVPDAGALVDDVYSRAGR